MSFHPLWATLFISRFHIVPVGGSGLSQLLCCSSPLRVGVLILPPREPAVGRVRRHPPQHTQPPDVQQAGQRRAKEREVHPHGVQGGPAAVS